MGVQIGLKDLYYALLTSDTAAGATYETPVVLAEAINAKITPAVSTVKLFADDVESEVINQLGSIDVELQVKDLPLSAQAALLGHSLSGGVIVKAATDEVPYVAIGFRSIKSNGKYRYIWMYKGKFSLQEQEYKTKGETPEFQTPSIKGTFVKRTYDEKWQAIGDEDDAEFTAASTWFDEVYPPASPDALTVGIVPLDEADPVDVDTTVVWTYNNAIQLNYLTANNFYLLDEGGAVVAGALSIDATSKIVTLTPTSNLAGSTLHIAVASGIVKDVYGQQVAAGNSVTTFTTAA